MVSEIFQEKRHWLKRDCGGSVGGETSSESG